MTDAIRVRNMVIFSDALCLFYGFFNRGALGSVLDDKQLLKIVSSVKEASNYVQQEKHTIGPGNHTLFKSLYLLF